MRQWRTIGASQPVQGSTYCSVGMIIAQAVWRETRSKTSVKWRRILKTCVVAFSITQSAFPVSWTNFASLNEIRRKGRLIVTKPWVTGFSAQEHLLRSEKSLRMPPLNRTKWRLKTLLRTKYWYYLLVQGHKYSRRNPTLTYFWKNVPDSWYLHRDIYIKRTLSKSNKVAAESTAAK